MKPYTVDELYSILGESKTMPELSVVRDYLKTNGKLYSLTDLYGLHGLLNVLSFIYS